MPMDFDETKYSYEQQRYTKFSKQKKTKQESVLTAVEPAAP